jgi:hypothetical protein
VWGCEIWARLSGPHVITSCGDVKLGRGLNRHHVWIVDRLRVTGKHRMQIWYRLSAFSHGGSAWLPASIAAPFFHQGGSENRGVESA